MHRHLSICEITTHNLGTITFHIVSHLYDDKIRRKRRSMLFMHQIFPSNHCDMVQIQISRFRTSKTCFSLNSYILFSMRSYTISDCCVRVKNLMYSSLLFHYYFYYCYYYCCEMKTDLPISFRILSFLCIRSLFLHIL